MILPHPATFRKNFVLPLFGKEPPPLTVFLHGSRRDVRGIRSLCALHSLYHDNLRISTVRPDGALAFLYAVTPNYDLPVGAPAPTVVISHCTLRWYFYRILDTVRASDCADLLDYYNCATFITAQTPNRYFRVVESDASAAYTIADLCERAGLPAPPVITTSTARGVA